MFQFAMLKKIMNDHNKINEVNRDSIPQLETDKSKKEKSEKEIPIQELSPKTKKLKEHIMKRNQSNDNFMKFSWSWTL